MCHFPCAQHVVKHMVTKFPQFLKSVGRTQLIVWVRYITLSYDLQDQRLSKCVHTPHSYSLIVISSLHLQTWRCYPGSEPALCYLRASQGCPWICSPPSFELPSPSLDNGCVPVLCPGPWWTLFPPLRGPGNKDGNRIQQSLEGGCHCVSYLLLDMAASLISQRVCLSVWLMCVDICLSLPWNAGLASGIAAFNANSLQISPLPVISALCAFKMELVCKDGQSLQCS